MLNGKIISRCVQICKIFAWVFYHDLGKFNQEIFLIQLDKIMARSYKDVLRNFVLSRSWYDNPCFVKSVKILHVFARFIKFHFTRLEVIDGLNQLNGECKGSRSKSKPTEKPAERYEKIMYSIRNNTLLAVTINLLTFTSDYWYRKKSTSGENG